MPFSKAMMFGETLIADEGGSVQSMCTQNLATREAKYLRFLIDEAPYGAAFPPTRQPRLQSSIDGSLAD
jgi:hypothetical protein